MSSSESIVCPNCSERSPGGYILCPYCGYDLTKIVRARERTAITFRESLSRIFRSLYDPRLSPSLFNEIAVNPDRKGLFIVLILISITYSMRLGALLLKAAGPTWHDFHFWFFLISPFILWIAFFPLALFGWYAVSIAIWLIAKLLGGKAGFRFTNRLVGYALGPLIMGSLVISLIIAIIGPGLTIIGTNTWRSYVFFDIIYLYFIGLSAYHCGNGIQVLHLLNRYYAYGIGAIVALFYIVLYFLPALF